MSPPPALSPPGPDRAYQRIVDFVENALAKGDLAPGDHLPSERDLVDRFGIGRASVREALRVLESKELIRSRAGDPHGALILPFSIDSMRRSIAFLASTHTLTLPELVQFRMVVESSTTLMAAKHRTAEQLLALERNLARMRAAMTISYETFGQLDLEFHEIIASAGGNKLLQIYGDATRAAILDLITQAIVDADDRTALMLQSLRHHTAVFAAIRDRDGRLAARLARQNLFDYYADHGSPADREILAELAELADETLTPSHGDVERSQTDG